MPYKSYVVWNNKGGTGKTTLTFQLSAEYAKRHPLETVVVIDMCPQANVSSALLANHNNPFFFYPGDVTVSTTSNGFIKGLSGKFYEKTVYGYLSSRLDGEMGTFNLMDFLTHVIPINKYISQNVFLMCGDLYLEALSKRLEKERQLLPTSYDNPWKRVTLFIKDYIESLSLNGNFVFFIDTNPSFSIYTEIAISAAQSLIVPFMADNFSLSAIRAMLYLVYGYQKGDHKRLVDLKESQYFWLANACGVQRPMLRMFINNRATFYKTRAASAFSALGGKVEEILKEVIDVNSTIFCSLFPGASRDICQYVTDLHDFHSAGVVSLHIGCPISLLGRGPHNVYGKDVYLQPDNGVYHADISKILGML